MLPATSICRVPACQSVLPEISRSLAHPPESQPYSVETAIPAAAVRTTRLSFTSPCDAFSRKPRDREYPKTLFVMQKPLPRLASDTIAA